MDYNYDYEKYLIKSKFNQLGIDLVGNGIPFCVAGGALTSIFSGMSINDLDIFFNNFDDLVKFQTKYLYENGSLKEGIYRFSTENAISFTLPNGKLQLIKKLYGNAEQVIKNFDFTVCMVAWDVITDTIIMNSEFLRNLSSRTLVFNSVGAKYPIASLWRVQKYLKRGFKFPAAESLKLALAINNLKITNYKELKEQLEGIDTLFLKELTDVMLEKKDDVYNYQAAIEMISEILTKKFNLEENA